MARLLLTLVVLSLSLFACVDEFSSERMVGLDTAGSSAATAPVGGEAGSSAAGGEGGSTEPGGSAGTATGGGATGGEPSGGGPAGGAGAGAGGSDGGSTAGGAGGTGGEIVVGGEGGTGGKPPVSAPYAESCMLPVGNVCRYMGNVKLTCGADATCHCDYGTLCRDSRFVGKNSPDVCQAGACAQEGEFVRQTCSRTEDCPGGIACNLTTHECSCGGGMKLCRTQSGSLACALWCDY